MEALPFATSIVRRLTDAGYTSYFAGGWVRDFLMGHPSDDIDIATSAPVEEIQALFPKTIPVGIAFGIVIVVENGHQFEVATFRKEKDYVDGRRPTHVERTTPEEDAKRRDFTINGMFYNPLTKELLDFVGGQKDIAGRVIRAIGDPHQRFLEDRLRMMRAVRYATRFGFPIEEKTTQAILAHATELTPAVAMERIWQEFKKMSQFAHFDAGLVLLHQLNLLQTIFPQLKGVPIEEIERRVKPIEHYPKDAPTIAELLELFPGSSLEDLIDVCDMLKLSNQDRNYVEYLHHAKNLLSMPESWQQNLELIEWAKLYAYPQAKVTLEIIAARMSPVKREQFLKEHHERQEFLQADILRIQTQKPIVRAEHLMKEGIPAKPIMSKLMKEAERISVNERLDDRDAIIQRLKQSPLWPS